MKYLGYSFCLLLFMLSGCGAVAIGMAHSASSDIDSIFKHEYAKYVIEMQDATVQNNILSFDEWFNCKYKVVSDYGIYFDTLKMYPELNKGKPLDYKDWIKVEPKPTAKIQKANQQQFNHTLQN
jgi:hypothetical protein